MANYIFASMDLQGCITNSLFYFIFKKIDKRIDNYLQVQSILLYICLK